MTVWSETPVLLTDWEKKAGFVRSPLSEPGPERDWSAPECPTLWCRVADTSALKRQKDRQRIEREGQTGSQRESKQEMGELGPGRVTKQIWARGHKQIGEELKEMNEKWTRMAWRERKRKSETFEPTGLRMRRQVSLMRRGTGSMFSGGTHGQLENNDPNNKSSFVTDKTPHWLLCWRTFFTFSSSLQFGAVQTRNIFVIEWTSSNVFGK